MARKRAAIRRVNIRPDDIELTNSSWLDGKFIITFVVWSRGQTIKYNVHLDFFWLGLIVEKIDDVLVHASDKIKEVKCTMRSASSRT